MLLLSWGNSRFLVRYRKQEITCLSVFYPINICHQVRCTCMYVCACSHTHICSHKHTHMCVYTGTSPPPKYTPTNIFFKILCPLGENSLQCFKLLKNYKDQKAHLRFKPSELQIFLFITKLLLQLLTIDHTK